MGEGGSTSSVSVEVVFEDLQFFHFNKLWIFIGVFLKILVTSTP